MIINLDGRLMSEEKAMINVLIPGILYGQGLFETILIQEGQPCFVTEHLERLFTSLPNLDMEIEVDKETITEYLFCAISSNKIVNGSARITVLKTENHQKSCIIIKVSEGMPYPDDNYVKGIKLSTVSYRNNPHSSLTYMKSCNFLNNVLARKEAIKKGAQEGLILNIYGEVAEGTISNVFAINNKQIITPCVDAGLLPGIVRSILLKKASVLPLPLREKNMTYQELVNADEIFVTNSLMGIMPVIKIDDCSIGGGVPGKITLKIKDFYENILRGKIPLNND